MGKLIYRMCLIVVLAIIVAGGVYYYTAFYQQSEAPERGTFVQNMLQDEGVSACGRYDLPGLSSACTSERYDLPELSSACTSERYDLPELSSACTSEHRQIQKIALLAGIEMDTNRKEVDANGSHTGYALP